MKAQHHLRIRSRQRPQKLWLSILAIVAIAGGIYLLLLVFAPVYDAPAPSSQGHENWNEPVPRTELKDQRVYIPRLSLNLRYSGSGEQALLDGLWHRFPSRGDPEKGGNFILAGHRFEIGYSPGETKRKSPLYHMDKIQTGDYLYADFNGKRYKYEVTRKYEVRPSQTEIESPSDTAKMTLYTCTLKGEADGREVLEAKLVEKDVDLDGELVLR